MGLAAIEQPDWLAEAPFASRVTPFVLFCGFLGALQHIIGGYDSGVTGGVFAFKPFLNKFYPELANRSAVSPYCTYASPDITVYSSIFFPFDLLGAFASSFTSRHWGRLSSLQFCAGFTIIGALLQVFAVDTWMILIGRCVLGFGNGFNEHVSAVYLAELAPAQLRGKFVGASICFGGLGVLVAQLVNWAVRGIENGWQYSLGMICIPSGILLLGSLFMVDSPNSLVTRGKPEAARRALQRLRGVPDVDAELADIERAAKAAAGLTTRAAWRLLAREKKYWPPIILAFSGVTFNWWSGNAAATFYSPQIFKLLGSGTDTALTNSVAMGVTKATGVIIGLCLLDRFKRRTLLFWSASLQASAQVVAAVLFAVYLADAPGAVVPEAAGVGILAMILLYELAFMAGQNTTVTAIMGEVPPLEIRPVAWVIITFGTALWGLINTLTFPYQLCAMKFGIYIFMASIATLLGLWALLLVPETNRIPVERLQATFARHWLWRRFYVGGGGDEESAAAAGGDASTRDQDAQAVIDDANRASRRGKA